MKWADPIQATCPFCGKRDEYPLADMLEFKSTCKACGESLDSIGQSMRQMMEEFGFQFTIIEILLELEQEFGVVYADEELGDTNNLTIRQLLDVTHQKTKERLSYLDLLTTLTSVFQKHNLLQGETIELQLTLHEALVNAAEGQKKS